MVSFIFQGNVSQSQYNSLLTFDITVERPGVDAAPAAVWFECTSLIGAGAGLPVSPAIYDPQFHEIIYDWDFGDPANAQPTTTLNLPERWKDQNEGRGRRVAHCYNDPGEYTVTCYAYEPATMRFGSRTETVTIADAATTFAGNRTIVIDPSGVADLSPLVSPNRVASLAAAITARQAIGAQPARIVLLNGSTLDFGAAESAMSTADRVNLRFEAFDLDGVKPVIRTRGREGAGNSSIVRDWGTICVELAFLNIGFDGEWDSTTETGLFLRPFDINKTGFTGASHLLMLHRCEFSGYEQIRGVYVLPADKTHYMMVSDTKVTNWQNYGITPGLSSRTVYNAVIGCAITQHENALSGGAKNGLYNNHGPYRDFGSTHSYVATSDFFSRNGWSVGGTLETVTEGQIRATAVQPALRINTDGKLGMQFYADRLKVEGHIEVKDIPSAGIDARPGNYLLDRVVQLLPRQDVWEAAVVVEQGGFTARNIFTVRLNTPQFSDTTSTGAQFVFKDTSSLVSNAPAGWRVAHCTMLDMRNDANTGAMISVNHQTPSFTSFAAENNLVHRPALSGAVAVSGEEINLGQVLDGVTCRDKGPRYGFLNQSGTFAADVPNGGSITIPYSQITDMPYNHNRIDVGTATDQAYWQLHEDTDTKHMFGVGAGDTGVLQVLRGQISVSFEAAGVVITNTSGSTWSSGGAWRLKLDRSSRLPTYDTIYDATTIDLNVTVNSTDTNTGLTGALGDFAYDDINGAERTVVNNKSGALV